MLEVSSRGIALNRIGNLEFAAAAATNVTPDHLDFHGDFGAYRAVKRAFVQSLSSHSIVLLNADDAAVREFARDSAADAILYGLSPAAQLRAEVLQVGPTSTQFRVFMGRTSVATVHLPLHGLHNVSNALAAMGIAWSYGIPPLTVKIALESFRPAERRLQTLVLGGKKIVITHHL